MHAVIVNSGIANACTGQEGFDACRKTAQAAEEALGIPYDTVAVASTGVIGMQLPVDKLVAGVSALAGKLKETKEAGTDASKAIMTTDTVNKEIAVTFEIGGRNVTLGGMSKGSGMIHPNMCTMLGFLTTDASIDKSLLQKALSQVVQDTFNMISVDGDTSTNDTLLVMANGLAGNKKIEAEDDDYRTFRDALFYVCRTLAMKMARDGEGASKLFSAHVVNAVSKADARRLARSVISSSLSKAAIFGCDANFGRFLCAMGYSGVDFDQKDVELFFESRAGRLQVFDHGVPLDFDEDEALKILKEEEVTIFIDMHEGTEEATAWGCDLTYDYVKINADYRS
jgi:glutamate N-acetyltransferase/amino-acid N-acetyltransferase